MRSALILAGTVLLVACAGPGTRTPQPQDWTRHSAQLAQLEHWTASGKLALRTAERSESATLHWRQQERESYLNLSGPMGVNATTVHSDGQRMEVSQGDERNSFDVSTPDAVQRNTGWQLPVQALPYWLKGLPSPDLEVQSLELDPDRNLLLRLQQDDWQIHYQDYQEFQGYTLPTRLRIQGRGTAVKIILRDWQTGKS
ncbi:MAG: outer membrane lipoprotein LolB [Haliea sp.]|nr:outer membrane lipoprotein LolB [Haliea sp.]